MLIPQILHNDLPTLDDQLDWAAELLRIGERIKRCPTPHVLGIHGDWGSGKTSFMRQLQMSLGGEVPDSSSVCRHTDVRDEQELTKLRGEVVTIWFDAWRYQNEPVPVVALLHEIRRQIGFMPAVLQKFQKIGTVAMYSVLDTLSDMGKIIGLEGLPSASGIEKRGAEWERDNHAEVLSSNTIRTHLHETIKCLLPEDDARVVIFIDDLDRCNSKAAVRLLEGLKIYLSIPDCIFVVGMNERILVDAVREEISAPKDTPPDELRLRASHYLEKICTDIYRLPLPLSASALLSHWLHDIPQKNSLLTAVGKLKCLPPNPRRLKALGNQWSRFASCIQFPSEADGSEMQQIWSVRVLVSAYIHLFHRDLWERWQLNHEFWLEILAWCNGDFHKRVKTEGSKWMDSLKLTHTFGDFDDISGRYEIKTMYSNPGDIDNFWIGTLIVAYRDQLKPVDFEPLLTAPRVRHG